jgi:hypothetical protein
MIDNLKNYDVIPLNSQEITKIEGGRFAYDVGFFLREAWVYASNGGGAYGTAMVGADLATNYHPKN